MRRSVRFFDRADDVVGGACGAKTVLGLLVHMSPDSANGVSIFDDQ